MPNLSLKSQDFKDIILGSALISSGRLFQYLTGVAVNVLPPSVEREYLGGTIIVSVSRVTLMHFAI